MAWTLPVTAFSSRRLQIQFLKSRNRQEQPFLRRFSFSRAVEKLSPPGNTQSDPATPAAPQRCRFSQQPEEMLRPTEKRSSSTAGLWSQDQPSAGSLPGFKKPKQARLLSALLTECYSRAGFSSRRSDDTSYGFHCPSLPHLTATVTFFCQASQQFCAPEQVATSPRAVDRKYSDPPSLGSSRSGN